MDFGLLRSVIVFDLLALRKTRGESVFSLREAWSVNSSKLSSPTHRHLLPNCLEMTDYSTVIVWAK